VSVFQPVARVVDPNGRGWEIYAFRILLPERSAGDSPLEYHGVVLQIFGGIGWLVRSAMVAVVRLVVDLPVAAWRARRSDEWTIEAVSWAPSRHRYTWKTTREHRGQVLAQVEGGIERGEMPKPRNAQLVRVD
jgi:hypothetical protein